MEEAGLGEEKRMGTGARAGWEQGHCRLAFGPEDPTPGERWRQL